MTDESKTNRPALTLGVRGRRVTLNLHCADEKAAEDLYCALVSVAKIGLLHLDMEVSKP